jgi:hypothetical protein
MEGRRERGDDRGRKSEVLEMRERERSSEREREGEEAHLRRLRHTQTHSGLSPRLSMDVVSQTGGKC